MRRNYFWYQFFRYPVVGTGLRFFYRRIKITGKDQVPKDKPILFVPNHQNSFMDALHVTSTTYWPVTHFLTRAEAFRPKPVGWFLRSLNMLPVYRVRDGFSSVQKNNAIFEKCFQYLKKNQAVLVFAEANHNLKRRIRPLSKGFTRIAFGAEENENWNAGLNIVPVGINYTEHQTADNTVHVVYGKPIPVSSYKSQYFDDQNAATQKLKDDVSEAMKELVFHVPSLEEYPLHKILWESLEPDDEILTNPEISNKRIQKTIPHISDELLQEAKELTDLAENNNINLRDFTKNETFSLKNSLLLPAYLFSYLNNIIPYQPVKYIINNVIRDRAFDASIKFLVSLIGFPVFYIIIALLMALFGVNSTAILIYLIASIISAPLFVRAKNLLSKSPLRKLKEDSPEIYRQFESTLDKFRDFRNTILNE